MASQWLAVLPCSSHLSSTPCASMGHCLLYAMSLRHSAGFFDWNTSISLSDTSRLLAAACSLSVGAGWAAPRRCRVDGASATGSAPSLLLLLKRLPSSGMAARAAGREAGRATPSFETGEKSHRGGQRSAERPFVRAWSYTPAPPPAPHLPAAASGDVAAVAAALPAPLLAAALPLAALQASLPACYLPFPLREPCNKFHRRLQSLPAEEEASVSVERLVQLCVGSAGEQPNTGRSQEHCMLPSEGWTPAAARAQQERRHIVTVRLLSNRTSQTNQFVAMATAEVEPQAVEAAPAVENGAAENGTPALPAKRIPRPVRPDDTETRAAIDILQQSSEWRGRVAWEAL